MGRYIVGIWVHYTWYEIGVQNGTCLYTHLVRFLATHVDG